MLATLDKRLTELRSKRARQEKLVADLTAPAIELQRLQQEEADAERAYQAVQAEREQLRLERADVDAHATCVPSTAAEIKTALKVLEAHERAYGGATTAFSMALAQMCEWAQKRVELAERRDRLDARIKELEG